MAQDDMVARIKLQAMKRAAVENDSSRAKKQHIIKGKTMGCDNLRKYQQPMKRKAMEDNNSIANKQIKKKIATENDKTRADQQRKKGIAVESVNSRTNQQPMKRVATEIDSSRTKQQPKKRVVTENGKSSGRKKEKKVPMCPPILIEDFFKQNGEVGEEDELGDESEHEELNIMEQEANVNHEEDGELNGNKIEGIVKRRVITHPEKFPLPPNHEQYDWVDREDIVY
ncbi:hypothetical protein RIF29_29925 [Crotalaria pallida]|uniref:Uncharacterized protein n=1 Tax=Crotalaria pallida TaxID=3830 RepID=A0AAN9EGA2_CROPI